MNEETSAVEILKNRYIKGNPEREQEIQEERENLEREDHYEGWDSESGK